MAVLERVDKFTHAVIYTHTHSTKIHIHIYIHTHSIYIPHTLKKHELTHIAQPPLEVTDATVSPFPKTDARY